MAKHESSVTMTSSNSYWKVWVLGSLYFCQGLPYGFQDKLLPLILRSKGVSYTGVSLVKLLWLPWLCKVAFAPLLDQCWTKTSWLYTSLLSLCLLSIFTSFIQPDELMYLSLALLLFNLLSAFQDVSVDGVALDILDDTELGTGNSAQVGGYKLGALFGGGFLFWLMKILGWSGAYLCLSAVYAMVAFVAYSFLRGQKPRVIVTRTPEHQDIHYKSQWYQTIKEFFLVDETVQVVIFILIYKLGEQSVLGNFPVFLLDQKISTSSLSFWNGIVGQSVSLIGSLTCGFFLKNSRDIVKILTRFCWLRTLPLMFHWCATLFWPDSANTTAGQLFYLSSITSLCFLHFFGGVITTATFTLMMSCSQKMQHSQLQATCFTTLASLEVFGKLMFLSFAGSLLDVLPIPVMYFTYLLFNFLSIMYVPKHIAHKHVQ